MHFTLSEQFQIPIDKSPKEPKSMHLSNKYMTTHFPGLVQLIGRTRNSEKDI